MANNQQNEFLEKVFPAELEEVRRRREDVGMDKGELTSPPSAKNLLAVPVTE
jgi:hypothetical protein